MEGTSQRYADRVVERLENQVSGYIGLIGERGIESQTIASVLFNGEVYKRDPRTGEMVSVDSLIAKVEHSLRKVRQIRGAQKVNPVLGDLIAHFP